MDEKYLSAHLPENNDAGSHPQLPPGMAEPLTYVERIEVEGVVVLAVVGELDLASVEILRTAFGGAMIDHDRIVLDLSRTTFADSTALGVFVAAGKRAAESGGWVRIANPRPNVRKLLRVTALDTIFGLYDDVEQARREDPDLVSD
jgi:anti-sigma B factor antagonist